MRNCVGAGGNQKKYLDGCTVGLMAWLYERVPSLGTTQKLIKFFRLYWWGECKLPNKVHDVEDRLKSITTEMVFEFNPTSQELYLLNLDSAVATIVRAKDQKIKELKKRVAELEAATNKDLYVGDNDGEEKERKYEEEDEEDEEDEEIDEKKKDDEDEDEDEEEEEKAKQDEQKEEKTKEGQDDKKGEKENGKDKHGKEKECEKEEERKDGDDDEERDHDTDNEHNDMNEENQTKHRAGQVSCHHEIEMNKKIDAISQKLDFGQDVDFGERHYEAVCTLSSIVDDLDSLLSTTPAKRAKQRNEESNHGEEKKIIPEQEKVGPPKKKMVRPEVECEGI
ncbi:hypothetical protein CDL12_24793 [Handroanthus impetiginosus]|uniref:Ubiquitinyl hydrolase 1 n=1 Tax=Handroanthus impetiginosus TaxID=429701 RepID=A0A2G9GBM6_9LAMI|nr:hypothetical protein CDL12_24793 [Handroanthus impetiginosus]